MIRNVVFILGVALATVATAATAPSHLERHRQEIAAFQRMLESDAPAALAFAKTAVDRTRALARNDPSRADAIELLVLAHVTLEQFEEAIGPAAELVRIRKAARPANPELVGLAQGPYALALFALGRAAEADRVLRDQLGTWRQAYGRNDLRLAQKLEQHAELVQKGLGRTHWAVELLAEAVAIRDANGSGAPGRLAATLQELALQRLKLHQLGDADDALARAERILETLVAADPAGEEAKAGLAQTLVLRAGIAGTLARIERARELATAARAIRFRDRLLAAENEIVVAAALSGILEMAGDLPGAIAQQRIVLDVFARHADLVTSGALDGGGIADAESWLASLLLAQGELAEAGASIASARRRAGDTADLLFLSSELERRQGRDAAALELYRKALSLRKESATEVTILFGTNRRAVGAAEAANFGGESGDTLAFGEANVLVPGGSFSDEAWLRPRREAPLPVGRATNPERLVLRSKKVLPLEEVKQRSRASLASARLYADAALVFVHGYNVSFDDALRRGAQLKRDLNFDGAAFVYSWPSKGSMLDYWNDRAAAAKAATGLKEFLQQVERVSGARRIHVLAHSMGNRVLLPALATLATDRNATLKARIGEVILAAPAVPQDDFVRWVDAIGRSGIDRITLYASAVDRALFAGNWAEGRVLLAGYVSGGQPIVHPSVNSIDVSEAAVGGAINLNHDVFAANPVLTEDMRRLLQDGERRPEKRIPLLKPRAAKPIGRYWRYELPRNAR